MFKKKPPNSKNGIIIGGPIDNAIEIFVLIQEIKYPVKLIIKFFHIKIINSTLIIIIDNLFIQYNSAIRPLVISYLQCV